MEVDAVEKRRGKVWITIGGEKWIFTRAQYQERSLLPGDEVDTDELEKWLLLRQFRPAMEYTVSLLASRPHSEGELQQKLRRIGYRDQTVELVLYKLRKYHLLDDDEFARQWAQARAARMGSRRIALELRQKGISDDGIKQALESVADEDSAATARALAEKALRRAKPGEDRGKTVQRAMAALARRGFSYEEAKNALDAALAEEE